MKLWHCDWVPTSVADWLCGELEAKGIPGTTYTHTLFSLLHPYFCPHPVPEDPSTLHSKELGDINLGTACKFHDADLIDELEGPIHPDADFPDLEITSPLLEGSRQAKKRHKKKLQQLLKFPDKAWKAAALECLGIPKDESFKQLIDELFVRLQDKKSLEILDSSAVTASLQHPPRTCSLQESCPVISVDKSVNLKESSEFPPLLACKNSASKHALTKGNQITSATKDSFINDLSHTRNENDSDDPIHNMEKQLRTQGIAKENLEMELGFNLRNDTLNDSLQTEGHSNGNEVFLGCFIGKVNHSQVGNEDMNVNDTWAHVVEDSKPLHEDKLEEWEVAEVLEGTQERNSIPENSFGSRLFARSIPIQPGRPPVEKDLDQRNEIYDTSCQPPVAMHEQQLPWSYKKEPWEDSFSQTVWDSISSSNAKKVNGSTHSSSEFPDLSSKNSFPLQAENNHAHVSDWQMLLPNSFECAASSSSEIWQENKAWNSLPPLNPKLDSLIGSIQNSNFQHNFRELENPDGQISLSSLENKNRNPCWPDLNKNLSQDHNECDSEELIPPMPSHSSADSKSAVITEELCQSFKQLKLKELWEKNPTPHKMYEHVTLNDNVPLPSNFTYDNLEPLGGLEKEEDELDNKSKSPQIKGIGENVFIQSIPSGPCGPFADLKHTESSGFKTVIPNNRSMSLLNEPMAKDHILVTPKQSKVEDESKSDFMTIQEEENLLTSPRTHFRPIRQDSYGSCQDDKSEDSQGGFGSISAGYQNPDLIFQRTGSGNLFLEVDILEGSPKKYMAYREPAKATCEMNSIKEDPPTSLYSDSSPSTNSPFVPKFKLINNEKFCQTEKEIDSPPTSNKNNLPSVDYASVSVDKEGRELKFQNMLEGSVKYLWKMDSPKESKLSWESDSSKNTKEAWELEFDSDHPLSKFSSFLGESQPSWSHEEHFDSTKVQELSSNFLEQMQNPHDLYQPESENKNSLSRMKFLWQKPNLGDEEPESDSFPANPKAQLDFALKPLTTSSSSWHSQLFDSSKDIGSEVSSSIFEQSNPWNLQPFSKPKDSFLESCDKELSGDVDEPQSRWQLQWEVDQEADEILGELMPNSPLKSSPTNGPSSNSGALLTLEKEEGDIFDFFEEQPQPLPVEDLDNLEPGWDLNEGFEWDPTTEEEVDGEEVGHEVLVYETEDGQTVMVPVEYLDDSLYDQFFGAPTDTPIGGSLPTLSQGQLEEWKSGKISYKISRRSKSRFQPPSRRPCSYFLEGNCRRSDCKFSHDLSSITCRFWEEGSCLKGDTCPFLHGFDAPPPRRRNRSEGDQALGETLNFVKLKEKTSSGSSKGHPIPKVSKGAINSSSFEIDSETDFPSLSSSLESKTSCLEESIPSKSRVTKLSKKKQKFITVTKTLFKEISSKPEGSRSTKAHKRRTKHVSSDPNREGEEKCSESLRKILKKKQQQLPTKPYNHEDGTLSDY